MKVFSHLILAGVMLCGTTAFAARGTEGTDCAHSAKAFRSESDARAKQLAESLNGTRSDTPNNQAPTRAATMRDNVSS